LRSRFFPYFDPSDAGPPPNILLPLQSSSENLHCKLKLTANFSSRRFSMFLMRLAQLPANWSSWEMLSPDFFCVGFPGGSLFPLSFCLRSRFTFRICRSVPPNLLPCIGPLYRDCQRSRASLGPLSIPFFFVLGPFFFTNALRREASDPPFPLASFLSAFFNDLTMFLQAKFFWSSLKRSLSRSCLFLSA